MAFSVMQYLCGGLMKNFPGGMNVLHITVTSTAWPHGSLTRFCAGMVSGSGSIGKTGSRCAVMAQEPDKAAKILPGYRTKFDGRA
jgi:hypothetical protein